MSLEDEIAQHLAEELSKEIDKEIMDTIMIDVLKDREWTETKINPAFGVGPELTDWYSRTAEWIHLNARGEYKLLKGRWFFEQQEDAVMFTLKWS